METYTDELIAHEEFEDERIRYKDSTYDCVCQLETA